MEKNKELTPMMELIEKLEQLRDLHSATGNLSERTARGKYVFAILEAKKLLPKEKQVIEDILIDKINLLGFKKISSNELNSLKYQPFITDEDGNIWIINTDALIDYYNTKYNNQIK